MTVKLCTAEYMLADDRGLGMRQTWFPRVVSETFLGSTKDGEIKLSPDPVTLIDGGVTWFNNSPDPQAVTVQVWRAPRTIVAQSPATVIVHDAWSFQVGESPAAPFPSVMQDSFGGKAQVDRPSVRPEDMQYGRLFYDEDSGQAWVDVGLVPPRHTLHFRYIAAVQTPGVWVKPSEFEPRWEVSARWARLVVLASPYPVTDDIAVQVYPSSSRAFIGAGNYSYRPPGWMAGHDELDVVGLGGGGGGEGQRWDGKPAAGGFPAAWAPVSLVYGVDFNSSTDFSIVVGKGGAGGGWGDYGRRGDDTVIAWTSPAGASREIRLPGGLGGNVTDGNTHPDNGQIGWGLGPKPTTYRGQTYPGGGDVQPSTFQPSGAAPGGAGVAGLWMQNGTAGAAGAAWFNARHVA